MSEKKFRVFVRTVEPIKILKCNFCSRLIFKGNLCKEVTYSLSFGEQKIVTVCLDCFKKDFEKDESYSTDH